MTQVKFPNPTHPYTTPVLVTGGTGFVGSHLIEYLQSKGFKNLFATSYSDQTSYVSTLIDKKHIIPIDLRDMEAVKKLLFNIKPRWIFHLASIASTQQDAVAATKSFQNNVNLQLTLLNAIYEVCPESRVLAVGSAMEYGSISAGIEGIDELTALEPTTIYAVSKVAQDLLAAAYTRSFNLDIVRVRPFNHIGERQTKDFAIPAFASQIARIEQGKQFELQVGRLDAVRDFSDVKDVVRAYVLLMEKGVKGEVYNIGRGEGVTMKEVLDTLCSLASKEIPVVVDPNRLKSGDVSISIANNKKLAQLGWQAEIPLKDTLQRVLNEWRGLVGL